jgi:hypothetical protein
VVKDVVRRLRRGGRAYFTVRRDAKPGWRRDGTWQGLVRVPGGESVLKNSNYEVYEGPMSEPEKMLFQPHSEFWNRHYCPKCSIENWTYHSHSERFGVATDPKICECHSCHRKYWLAGEADVRDCYPEFNDEILTDTCGAQDDVGLPKPD